MYLRDDFDPFAHLPTDEPKHLKKRLKPKSNKERARLIRLEYPLDDFFNDVANGLRFKPSDFDRYKDRRLRTGRNNININWLYLRNNSTVCLDDYAATLADKYNSSESEIIEQIVENMVHNYPSHYLDQRINEQA